MSNRNEDSLKQLIEPIVTGFDLTLWGVEVSGQSQHRTVRVFIDSESGISVENCEAVSRQLSSVFDVEEPIAGEYTLEVSSPGMDRGLFEPEQYAQFVGEKVRLRLRRPFEGRRKFSGTISGVADGDLSIIVDDYEYELPIDGIEKANLIPSFS